jgi:hypothetical protein
LVRVEAHLPYFVIFEEPILNAKLVNGRAVTWRRRVVKTHARTDCRSSGGFNGFDRPPYKELSSVDQSAIFAFSLQPK